MNVIEYLNICHYIDLFRQIVLASLSAGVVLLSVLARYLGRRKTSRIVRRPRIVSGRRTRNSMRSPNGKFIQYNCFHSKLHQIRINSKANIA